MALLSDKKVLWSQLFYQTGVKFGKSYVSLHLVLSTIKPTDN